jgi:hypothetical protein
MTGGYISTHQGMPSKRRLALNPRRPGEALSAKEQANEEHTPEGGVVVCRRAWLDGGLLGAQPICATCGPGCRAYGGGRDVSCGDRRVLGASIDSYPAVIYRGKGKLKHLMVWELSG